MTDHLATQRDLEIVARLVAAAHDSARSGNADSGALTLAQSPGPATPFETVAYQTDAVAGEWVTTPGAAVGGGVLLYLHARRFQFHEPPGIYAAALSAATGRPVLLLHYRLAPQHPYPAALDDAVAAYQALLTGHPAAQIVLAGHSAGATLALSALQVLRDAGQALPAGAVALSPITDFTLSGKSLSENESTDVISLAETRQVRSAYLGAADPAAAPQSPLAGDCAGLPSLLIACGGAEMLRDDALRFAARSSAAGVDVDLEVFEGMPHGFPVMPVDAAQVLLARIAAFTARLSNTG
jgi:acetyl esterase/lipase